jgi:hypothetical protein
MFALELASRTFEAPWWLAAAAAAVIAVLFVTAFVRAEPARIIATLAKAGAVLLALLLGLSFLDHQNGRDRTQERRALDARVLELTTQASRSLPLFCLDALAGEVVEEACEANLFASPENVAAAVSYTAARLKLLAAAADLSELTGDSNDVVVEQLRRALERDRFGLAAQVLAVRDQCTADKCDAFAFLRDSSWIASNLREHAFDIHVARHAPRWSAFSAPQASVAPAGAGALPAAPQPPAVNAPANANFPSAASIPAVSIMNNEPGMTGQNGMDTARPEAKAETKSSDAKAAPRAARRAPARSEAPTSISPPLDTTPAPASAGTPPQAQ